jgi:glutathione S-transferase
VIQWFSTGGTQYPWLRRTIPALAAYAERLLARPAYQKALARDAELDS